MCFANAYRTFTSSGPPTVCCPDDRPPLAGEKQGKATPVEQVQPHMQPGKSAVLAVPSALELIRPHHLRNSIGVESRTSEQSDSTLSWGTPPPSN
jgi:hypothetical protein